MNDTELEFERDASVNKIYVHARKCGRVFRDIAVIHGPDGENPLIEIPRPLGANAIRRILNHVQEA